jgi:hypothetical protein
MNSMQEKELFEIGAWPRRKEDCPLRMRFEPAIVQQLPKGHTHGIAGSRRLSFDQESACFVIEIVEDLVGLPGRNNSERTYLTAASLSVSFKCSDYR